MSCQYLHIRFHLVSGHGEIKAIHIQFLTMSGVTFSHEGPLFPDRTELQVHRSLSSLAPGDLSLPLSLKLHILIGAF